MGYWKGEIWEASAIYLNPLSIAARIENSQKRVLGIFNISIISSLAKNVREIFYHLFLEI